MVLTPFINQPFDAPVWRMEIDEATNTLFVELRNNNDKQVSFAGIDFNSGKTNFKNLTMPERWLTGLEAAYNGVLLLHGYQNEAVPIHKGLTGINGGSGEVLWADYNITFDTLSSGGFVVYDARIQPKKLFVVDFRTGQRTGTYNPAAAENIGSSIIFPNVLEAELVPADLLPVHAYGNEVHYLNHNNFRIVSLHALNAGALTQHLYVWNSSGQLVFENIISDNIQKLQPEAFISYKNKLIWLKNRSEVKVLNL